MSTPRFRTWCREAQQAGMTVEPWHDNTGKRIGWTAWALGEYGVAQLGGYRPDDGGPMTDWLFLPAASIRLADS